MLNASEKVRFLFLKIYRKLIYKKSTKIVDKYCTLNQQHINNIAMLVW